MNLSANQNITANSQQSKNNKTDNILMPKPLFERPNASLTKLRRDIKMQKLKGWPTFYKHEFIRSTLPVEMPDNDFTKNEWLPNDDYLLLKVIIYREKYIFEISNSCC